MSLWFYRDRPRTDDFLKRYRYVAKAVDKLYNSKLSKQNDLLSNRPFVASRYRSLSFHMSGEWNIFTGTNTLSTLSSNSKSSRIVDLQFFHKLLFYFTNFMTNFSLFNDTDEWRYTIVLLIRTNFYYSRFQMTFHCNIDWSVNSTKPINA